MDCRALQPTKVKQFGTFETGSKACPQRHGFGGRKEVGIGGTAHAWRPIDQLEGMVARGIVLQRNNIFSQFRLSLLRFLSNGIFISSSGTDPILPGCENVR
jgi:hypothetical protein